MIQEESRHESSIPAMGYSIHAVFVDSRVCPLMEEGVLDLGLL